MHDLQDVNYLIIEFMFKFEAGTVHINLLLLILTFSLRDWVTGLAFQTQIFVSTGDLL